MDTFHWKLIIRLWLLVLLAFVPEVSAEGYYKIDGRDFVGTDIIFRDIPFAQCLGECTNKFPRCVAVVLKKEAGQGCWLKSNLVNEVVSPNRDTFIQVGYVPQRYSTRQYVKRPYFGYPYNDIGFLKAPTDQCKYICDQTENCVAYVLDKSLGDKGCLLKKKLGEIGVNQNKTAFIAKDFAPEDPAPRKYITRKYFGYNDNDLGVLDIGIEECKTICDRLPDCQGFMLDDVAWNGCLLKSKFDNKTPNSAKTAVIAERFALIEAKPRNYIRKPFFDYVSNDIAYMNIPVADCGYICTNLPGCIAYVIDNDTNSKCWFKSKLSNAGVAMNKETYYVAGSVQVNAPKRSYIKQANFDYSDGTIATLSIPVGDCDQYCDNTAGCIGFTVQKGATAGCTLKKALSSSSRTLNQNIETYYVAGSVQVNAPKRSYSKQANFDYSDGTIATLSIPVGDCDQYCDNTAGCIGFTVQKGATSGCTLKKALSSSSRTLNQNIETYYVAGSVQVNAPKRSYSKQANFDYSDGTIATLSIPVGDCDQYCDNTAGCIGFTVQKGATAGCTLKKALSSSSRTLNQNIETYYVAGSVQVNAPKRSYSKQANFDYSDGTIAMLSIPVGDCDQYCDNTAGCIGFTVQKGATSGCTLKKALSSSSRTLNQNIETYYVAGSVQVNAPKRSYSKQANFDYSDGTIAMLSIPVGDCDQYCDNTAGCIGFTVQKGATSGCTLKKALSSSSRTLNQNIDTYYVAGSVNMNITAKKYVKVSGVNFANKEVAFLDVPIDQCENYCDSVVSCIGFITDNKSNHGCWFKDKLENRVVSRGNSLFALEDKIPAAILPREYSFQPGYSYSGADIVFVDVPFSKCPGSCDQTANCIGFVTNNAAGRGCWLKSKLEQSVLNSQRNTFAIPGSFPPVISSLTRDGICGSGNTVLVPVIPI